jgi:hypothetical protein
VDRREFLYDYAILEIGGTNNVSVKDITDKSIGQQVNLLDYVISC